MVTPLQDSALRCWICGESCRLEDCKIDEHGRAVHEVCHVAKLTLKNGSDAPRPQPN